jgi:hypothetical protein
MRPDYQYATIGLFHIQTIATRLLCAMGEMGSSHLPYDKLRDRLEKDGVYFEALKTGWVFR